MQYECQQSLLVVYYSILQYSTAASQKYGYQPGLSVVYYSILQNITATSWGTLFNCNTMLQFNTTVSRACR
jgi:hypothetical protein